jgi:hypothetical protein
MKSPVIVVAATMFVSVLPAHREVRAAGGAVALI